MLSEEVAVNNLNQAVELLDSQQARRNIQDEFREHFATRRNASDIVQKHGQPQHPYAVPRWCRIIRVENGPEESGPGLIEALTKPRPESYLGNLCFKALGGYYSNCILC